MLFDYKLEKKGSTCIIHLSGNLIEGNQAIPLLKETDNILQDGTRVIILELKNLKYMNSMGLGTLITMLTKARKTSGEVIICGVSQKIKELLIITKLNSVFTVTETLEEAIKKIK